MDSSKYQMHQDLVSRDLMMKSSENICTVRRRISGFRLMHGTKNGHTIGSGANREVYSYERD